MVVSCPVVGCSSRFKKENKLGFFRFPREEPRRQLWILALKRKDWVPSRLTRICGKHFQTGKPANFKDVDNPDWVPSINLGYENEKSVKGIFSRYHLKKIVERETITKSSHKSIKVTPNHHLLLPSSTDTFNEDTPETKPDVLQLALAIRNASAVKNRVKETNDIIASCNFNQIQMSKENSDAETASNIADKNPAEKSNHVPIKVTPNHNILPSPSSDTFNEDILEIKPDVLQLALAIRNTSVVKNKVKETNDIIASCNVNQIQISEENGDVEIASDTGDINLSENYYQKLPKVRSNQMTTESADIFCEGIPEIKPDVLHLTFAVIDPASDINRVEQTHNDRTLQCGTNRLQMPEEDSDTETASETEDVEFSDVTLNSIHSSSLSNTNSEQILKQKLINMIICYERAREKMELYRQKWKICLKQVTALENIIDNLKAINSITDDS